MKNIKITIPSNAFIYCKECEKNMMVTEKMKMKKKIDFDYPVIDINPQIYAWKWECECGNIQNGGTVSENEYELIFWLDENEQMQKRRK